VALPPHVLEFSSDDPLATATLDALYHAARITDAPPTLRYALHDAGPDAYIATSPHRPPFGPAPLADCWVFLEWRAIEDVLNDPGPEVVFIHAAGVRLGDRLVLLVGPSGSGKSTLTALLLERGYAALGDDVLRFAPLNPSYHAVPRSLKLDRNTFAMLGLDTRNLAMKSRGTFFADSVHYLSPLALNRAWEADPGLPWGVVVLGEGLRDGPARLERSSEGQAAVRVVQSLMGARYGMGAEATADAGLRLLESVANAQAFRAEGSGAAELAELIVEAAQA